MRRLIPSSLVALLFAATLLARPADNKLPDAVTAIFDKATEIELLVLHPTPQKDDDKDFHGYKVLGKVTIKDGATRKAILAALYKGIKDSDGSAAKCFNPRHGIHATAGGKSVDLVICFECLQIEIYSGTKREHGVLTTRSPQKTFDKILTEAKVPMPPKEGK